LKDVLDEPRTSTMHTNDINRPWIGIPATGPFVRVGDAAAYLGISKSTYYEEVSSGSLPICKIGRRASGVPKPWLDAVIAARVAASRIIVGE
jgi:excisionase family DNA binding protein